MADIYLDGLGQVTVPLNASRLLIKQNVNGTETDSKILFSDLVANLVNSSIIGTSVGQVPTLVSGTSGAALPAISGENLTTIPLSLIPEGTNSATGTTKLSSSTTSTSGESSGFAATPSAVNSVRASLTNLVNSKASLTNNNNFFGVNTFKGATTVEESFTVEEGIKLEDFNEVTTFKSLWNDSNALKWGTSELWDKAQLQLSSSNTSNESTGWATTPTGVNSRIDYQLGQQVFPHYLKLASGSTQTLTGSLVFGSASAGTNPASGAYDYRGVVAFNDTIAIKDLTQATPAKTLLNLGGELGWGGETVLTSNTPLGSGAYADSAEIFNKEVNEIFEADGVNDVLMTGHMISTTKAQFFVPTNMKTSPSNTGYFFTGTFSIVTLDGTTIGSAISINNTDLGNNSSGRVLDFKVLGLTSTTKYTPVKMVADSATTKITVVYP